MTDIENVLREMRDTNTRAPLHVRIAWADEIEAAMREPKAYYWMSSKWHCYEVHMADDLPCNAPHDMRPLFAFPPDAAAEIRRLEERVASAADGLRERDREIERLRELLFEACYVIRDEVAEGRCPTRLLTDIRAALDGKEDI